MASADANALVGQVSADEVGRVEARGIDYVPETDRHSHPRDLRGPLTRHVSGIDLSFISAALVGGALYFALVKIFPERRVTRLA